MAMTGIMCLSANAGQWKTNTRGWWYDNGNGTWPANSWQWIDGNNDGVAECYYFDKYGYCVIGTTTQDGYTTNENGAWTVNGTIQTKAVGTNSAASQTASETAVYKEAEEAYKKYLRSLGSRANFPIRYDLVYLDNDDVPELMYANGDYHNSHVGICLYKNGKVIPVENNAYKDGYGQFGRLTFYPKSGYIKNIYTIFGTESDYWYSIRGSSATELVSTYYNYNKEDGSADEFSINEVEASREAAESYVQQLVGNLTESVFEYSRAKTLQ